MFASGRISRLLLTTLYFVVIATDIYTCKNIFTGLDTSRQQKPSVTASETDDAEVSLSTCTRMYTLQVHVLHVSHTKFSDLMFFPPASDVLVFAGCSLVLLFSSIIFLIGVIILRRYIFSFE